MSERDDKAPGEFQLSFFSDGEAAFFAGGGIESEAAERYAKATGTTTERRVELCRWAKDVYLQTGSQRRVAEVCGVGRNTVSALVARWEASGELEPLKQRLAGQFRSASALALETWVDAVHAGAVPPSTLPVAAAIFADKSLLLSGEPTAIVAGQVSGQPTIEDLRRYVASLPAVEVESEPVAGQMVSTEVHRDATASEPVAPQAVTVRTN